jgi:hypothetical protein
VATAVDELTYVSFPITKWDKNDDGDLVVYGKATDGSVDSDEQIVSPEWSGPALKTWIETGGNVRVQHQALRDPAGKGISVEIDKDGDGGHWVKSLVVEPVAKRLVEKGVLTAYSVGIARPVINRDPSGKARGGIVAGGHLAELSLVDRPANKACGFILGKSDSEGHLELTGELEAEPEFLAKAIAGEELLLKQGSGDDGSGDAGAAASNSDDGTDGADGDGGSDAASTDDVDEDDAVSKGLPDEVTIAAYKAERKSWTATEPSVKGIAMTGTEYLAKRAEWSRWHHYGEENGFNGTKEGAERWLAKRDFNARERQSAASSGAAMPDGSFPIKNGDDLGNAIHLAGHAKDPGAARAHIKRRAAALGMSGRIPDSWKGTEEVTFTPLTGADWTKVLEALIDQEVAKALLGEDRVEELGKAANNDGTVGDNSSSFSGGSKPCPTCKGDGKIRGDNMKCPDCNGSGKAPAGKAEDAASADEVGDESSATAKADVGSSEDDPSAGTEVEQAEVGKGSKDCGGCGKSYDSDTGYKFCANCGKKLPGAKKSAKAAKRAAREAAIADLAATVLKSVEAGLITAEAGDEVIAEAVAAADLGKKRQLPADVHQAASHREPDGTSTVERLEPQAGIATDPDPVADKVPASVAAKGQEPSYAVQRMHDLMCAAYDPAETLASYPALKGMADAVDPGPFLDQAVAAMADGDTRKAAEYGSLVDAARAVKAADPEALADAAAMLHKSFSDMYPSLKISPSSGIRPGSYQRPYLSSGHSAESASSNGSANIPPSSHTPEPENFQRPLITAGHEADSPANRKADGGPPGEGPMSTTADFRTTTGSARTYYSNAQRDAAKAALQALHDHIAGSFPDLCPMASSKSVMPADMGATNTPRPDAPASQGGIPAVKADEVVELTVPKVSDGPEIQQAIADAIRRHLSRGNGLPEGVTAEQRPMTRKRLEKAAQRFGLDLVERRSAPAETGVLTPVVGPAGISMEEMKSLLSDQITPLIERHETQMEDLRKQVDEIGRQPDPAMAPVRGALARAPMDTPPVPVERRSLIDEAAEKTEKSAASQEAHYRAYVEALTRSPDPAVREAAMATMDKLSAQAHAAAG